MTNTMIPVIPPVMPNPMFPAMLPVIPPIIPNTMPYQMISLIRSVHAIPDLSKATYHNAKSNTCYEPGFDTARSDAEYTTTYDGN